MFRVPRFRDFFFFSAWFGYSRRKARWERQRKERILRATPRKQPTLLRNLLALLHKGQQRKSWRFAHRELRRMGFEPLEARQMLSGSGLTVRPLPPVIIPQGQQASLVSLTSAFRAADGSPAAVSYNIVSDSNPSLFASTPIAIPTGQMLLPLASGVAGAAVLTIQGTDAQGDSAEARLIVDVAEPAPTSGISSSTGMGGGFASFGGSSQSSALIGTIAGVPPYYGSGVPATDVSFQGSNGIAFDAAGNIYVADSAGSVVDKIDHDTGILTTIAGNGVAGYSGDGGSATSAELSSPNAVAVDSSGNVFIADSGNDVVRMVRPSGTITTFAGNGQWGYSGDGGPAADAEFSDPNDVAVDSSGNVYIADTWNSVVREVNRTTDMISTVAGTGGFGGSGDGGPATSATLEYPAAVAIDASGNIYIADLLNCAIREVDASTGIITTFAGNNGYGYSGDGGLATDAEMGYPTSLAIDASGNVFIGDNWNNAVREVVAATGDIYTIAGNGTAGHSGDGGAATEAELDGAGRVAVNAVGDVLIGGAADNVVREVNHITQVITTIAGKGGVGYTGDGGPATDAAFGLANGIATDAAGNLYVVDSDANVVREIDATTGIITTIAGTGIAGYSGDGGPATDAELNNPIEIAIDSSGDVFIADSGNNVIREIDTTGTITTIAGNGQSGYSGDGGLATDAELNWPQAVSVDSAGDVFIADLFNNVVREVYHDTGDIATVVGTGGWGYSGDGGPATEATMQLPSAVAVDASGNLYVSDLLNSVVREVDASSGIITTFAGNGVNGYDGDGGPATDASMGYAGGLAMDAAGDLFIGDNWNNAVREVVAATGDIYTIAGNGTAGYSGDGGPATNAELEGAGSPAVDGNGNVFISGGSGNVIREVYSSSVPVPTISLSAASSLYAGQDLTLTASVSRPSSSGQMPTGNVEFYDNGNWLGFGVLDTSGNASLTTSALAVGEHDLTVAYSGSVLYSSGTSNAATVDVVHMPTTVSLSASAGSAAYGQNITLTATVAPVYSSSDPPSGTVDFYDGTTHLGSATLNSSGQAVFSTSSLATPLLVGSHAVTAHYNGDDNNAPSTSAPHQESVTAVTLQWVGGSGTWSPGSTGAYWYDTTTGTNVPWSNLCNAVFVGAGGTVTISGTVSPATVTFSSNNYVIAHDSSSGSLAICSGGTSISVGTGLQATVSAEITGNGSDALTKLGSGTLIVSGSNSYTGTTVISDGMLQVGNDGSSGSLGSGNVTDDSVLVFDRSDNITISKVISGAGELIQAGGGTLTLDGANEYAGGTDVEAGQLTMGNAGAFGVSSGTLTLHGGLLDVNGNVLVQKSVVIYAGLIDLTTGGLVVNTANFGYVPLGGELSPQGSAGVLEWGAPAVHDAVEDGSNLPNGYWNGARGILSSSAANDSSGDTTVGYVDNTYTQYVSWRGTSVSSAQTLFSDTWYGDADLNGVVDYADYYHWLKGRTVTSPQGYHNGATAEWIDGDFSCDGTVNSDDYSLWAGSFTLNVPDRVFGAASIAPPLTLYWDPNGATGLGGTGTWNHSASVWTDSPAGSGQTFPWIPGSIAVFPGGSAVTINGAVSADAIDFQGDGSTLSGGTVNLAAADTPIDVGRGTATISSVIAGNGTLEKTGNGTLAISAINSYSGGTTISGGTLSIRNAAALPNRTDLELDYGGILDLHGCDTTINPLATVTLNNGSIVNGTLAVATTIQAYDGLIGAHLTGSAGLSVDVNGRLILGGTNSYTGPTVVSTGGLIEYLRPDAIPGTPPSGAELSVITLTWDPPNLSNEWSQDTSDVNAENWDYVDPNGHIVHTVWLQNCDAVFDSTGAAQSNVQVSTASPPISADSLNFAVGGYSVAGGPLSLVDQGQTNGSTIDVAAGCTASIATNVSASSTLTEIGSGTLTFNGSTGDVTVRSGTLTGSGAMNGLFVEGGATLLVNGVMHVNSISLQKNAVCLYQSTGSTVAEIEVAANGAPSPVKLGFFTGFPSLVLSGNFVLSNSGPIVLIENGSTNQSSTSGKFAGWVEGSVFPFNGVNYTLTYKYNSEAGTFNNGNDVALIPQFPGVPTSLQTDAISTNQVNLSWAAASGSVFGYNIYRGTTPGGEDYSAPINGTSLVTGTSFTDTTVAANTQYYYTVEAVCGALSSSPSSEANSTTVASGTLYWDPAGNPDAVVMSTGAGLGGSGTWSTAGNDWFDPTTGQDVAWDNTQNENAVFWGGAGTVTVSGSVNTASISFPSNGYDVVSGNIALPPSAGAISVASGNTATISTAIGGGGLTTSGGVLILSGATTCTDITIASGTLQLAGATALGSGPLEVDGTLDLDGYSPTVGDLSGAGTIGNSSTSTNSVLTASSLTGFSGSVTNNLSSGAATAALALAVPAPPTGLMMSQTSDTEIDLSWTAPDGTVTGYNIYRGTSAGGEDYTSPINGTTLVTSTSYSDTSVSTGTDYFYTVEAVNDTGSSGPSNECDPTPLSVATPSNLIATATSSSEIDLTWTGIVAPTNYAVTRYNIYRGTTSGSETKVGSVVPFATSYSDTGLPSPGTKYFYEVSAVVTSTLGPPPFGSYESAKCTEEYATTLPIGPLYWVGGSGAQWDTSSLNWSTSLSGGSLAKWSNGDIAVFAGTGESINVATASIYASAIDFESSNYVIAGDTLTLSTGSTSIDVWPGVGAAINSPITGSFGLTKIDSGILTLGGSNSYHGGTTISGGTLKLASGSALGIATSSLMVSSSTLDLEGQSLAVGALSGSGTITDNSTTTGPITVLTVSPSSSSTFTGAIQNGAHRQLALKVSGSGTLILTGASNNYSGGTTISSGTLQLAGGATLGLPSNSLTVGGTLDLEGQSLAVGALTGSGTITDRSSTSGSATTLTVSPSGSSVFAGAIQNGTYRQLALNVAGSGTLILTGTNNYGGGTNITQGTLQIGDGFTTNGTLGAGSYNVASGAKLYLDYATAPASGILTAGIIGQGTVELNSAQANAYWQASALSPFFAGTVQIDKGRLDTYSGGLGDTTNVIVNSGGELVAFGGYYTSAITIAGNGIGNTPYPAALSGAGSSTTKWAGPISLAGNAKILSASGNSFIITGSISGSYQCNFDAQPGTTIEDQPSASQNYASTEIADSGVVIAGNANAFSTGLLVMNGGNLQLNGNNLTFASLNDFFAGGQISNGGTVPSMLSVAAGTYTGKLVDGGSAPLALMMDGAGTLTLSGANSYSGGTSITGGALVLDGSSSLGAQTSGVTLSGTASSTSVLDLNGCSITVGDLNTGAYGSNTLVTSSNGAATLTVGGNNDTDNFYGHLSGSLGLQVLSGSGGTHTLCLFGQGDSTYTGPTTIDASALLSARGTNTLSPYSAVTVNAGGILDFWGTGSTIASLAGTGTVYSSDSGNVSTLTVDQSTSTFFSGTIKDLSGHDSVALAMAGTGQLTLSGSTNSYSGGTTIALGTLQLGSANALGSGLLTVDGTLDLAGHSPTVWALNGSGYINNSSTSSVFVFVKGVNDYTGSKASNVTVSYPSPLNGLLAVPTGNTEIDLSWNAAGGSVIGYNIYRGTAPGAENFSVPIAFVASTMTYRDTGLTPGTQYYYAVVAVNSATASLNSAECHATVPPDPDPTIGREPILYWAGNGQLGGSGGWDTTSADWRQNPNGTGPLVTWQNGDIAVFSGSSGVVVLNSGIISPSAIDFTVGNYTIVRGTGNYPLNLWTAGTTIDVAGGVSATIGTPITGYGALTLTGAGTLLLAAQQSNDYTYTGSTTVDGGLLEVNGYAATGLSRTPLVFTSNNATVQAEDGNVVFSGTIVTNLGCFANFDPNGFNMSVIGPITGAGGVSVGGHAVIPDPALRAAIDQALGLPTGTVPTTAQVKSLTSLTADSNQVITLQGLQGASNLQSLTLVPSNFAVQGHLLDLSLLTNTNFPNLTNLTLQGCGLDDTSILSLPTLAALKTLDLRYNSINTVSSVVANQPALTSLLLYGNPLGGSAGQTWYASLSGKLLTVDIAPKDTSSIVAAIDPTNPAATYSALAAAFYNLPLEIYQYVLNKFQYQPYQGEMKGPLAVLETGAGNDWDTDALLVGLLTQVSSEAVLQGHSALSPQYAFGRVLMDVQTVDKWLAVKTTAAAYDDLYLAGLNPTLEDQSYQVISNPMAGTGNAAYVVFDHAWVQMSNVTVPGSTTPQTVYLDPTWKFDDLQAGLPGLFANVSFNQGGYLSSAANETETAAEYYKGQVSSYLAIHDPGLTLADVAYAGPIHQQVITALPTTFPFLNSVASAIQVDPTHSGLGQTDPSNSIPSYLVDQLNITIQTTQGTTVLSSVLNVPAVSLERVTIGYTGTSTLTPHLYVNGSDATYTTQTALPTGTTNVNIILQSTPGNTGGTNAAYTHMYTRAATTYSYIAVGINAWQTSDAMVDAARQEANNADIAELDNQSWDTSPANQELLTGGILNLTMAEYFGRSNSDLQMLAGLTGGIPFYNGVFTGLATAYAPTTRAVPANGIPSGNLSFQYLPGSMGIDAANCDYLAFSNDESNVQSLVGGTSPTGGFTFPAAPDVARFNLIGCNASSLEGIALEAVTDTQSISTISSLQAAGGGVPVTSIAQIPAGLPSATQTSISNWLGNGTGYSVLVPASTRMIGTGATAWTGAGFIETDNNGLNSYYLLSGAMSGQSIQTQYGANDGGLPNFTAPFTTSLIAQLYAGEPVNTANGDVTHDETDFSIPNLGTPLEMVRQYDSINTESAATPDRGMGDGWSFTYSDTITASGTGSNSSVTWFTDTGIQLNFAYDHTSSGIIYYKTPNMIFGNLVRNADQSYTWTDKTGATTSFNSSGRLISRLDRYQDGVLLSYNGNTTTVQRVLGGAVAMNASAASLTLNFNGGHITSINDSTGRTWIYGYDSSGRLASVTGPSDANTLPTVTTYTYYSDSTLNDLLQSVTDPDGNVTTFGYYANRRGFHETDPQGDMQTFSYDLFRNRTSFTNEDGQTSEYDYDSNGDLIQEVNPDGTTLAYTWSNGLKLSDTDEYGQTESYTYDGNGNVLTFTNRLGEVTSYTYTDYSNPLTVMQQPTGAHPLDGSLTVYTYYQDGVGKNSTLRTVTVSPTSAGTGSPPAFPTGALLFTTSYSYPGLNGNADVNRGQPLSVTSPDGNVAGAPGGYTTWYEYNPAGQATAEYLPVSTPTSPTKPTSTSHLGYIMETYQYDNNANTRGYLTSSTDGNGNLTSYTYDSVGHMLTKTQPVPNDPGESLAAPVTKYTYDPVGNLVAATLATASPTQTTSTAYDGLGRVIRSVSSDGTYVSNQYDAAGNVVSSTDAMGRVTQYVHDSRNRSIATINPDGSVVRTEYDGGGRVVAITDGNGNTTTYSYDKLGRKLSVKLPATAGLAAATTSYYYDDTNDKQYVTNALGTDHNDTYHTTETDYDKLGRKIEVIQPAPAAGQSRPTTYYHYDANGNLDGVEDARGVTPTNLANLATFDSAHTTRYYYDESGRKTIEQDYPGGSLGYVYTWYYYDNNSNLQYVVVDGNDGQGATSLNRPTTFSSLASDTTQYLYDALDRKTSEINPQATVYSYQGAALVSQTARPTTSYLYDSAGNVTSVTDPNGNTMNYSYDLLGRRISTTSPPVTIYPDGTNAQTNFRSTTSSTYDADGNVLSTTDALGNVTLFTYDAMNRKIAEIEPLPTLITVNVQSVVTSLITYPTTTWTYDDDGNVTSTTDPNHNTTNTQYDGWNLPVAVTDALGSFPDDPAHTTKTAYTELGQVSTVTDPLGRTTKYYYDNLDRKIEEDAPDPLNGSVDGGSPKTYWGYDADGNVKYVTSPLGSGPADPNYTTWYFYDGVNRQICAIDPKSSASASWSVSSSPPDTISISPQPNKSTLTAYTVQGQVLSTTDELGRITNYGYDDLGRKNLVSEPAAYSLVNGTETLEQASTIYRYDLNGNLLATIDADGHTTWTIYDALNRVIDNVSADGSGPADANYTTVTRYDAVGNVTAVVDPQRNATTMTYDALGRRISQSESVALGSAAAGGSVTATSTYQYDLDGNLTQSKDADNQVKQYTYDALGRQVADNWLDSSGNVFHTITTYYDADGETIGVTETDVATAGHATANLAACTNYEYTYDGDGNVHTSRMAPGDIAGAPLLTGAGSGGLGTSGTWSGTGDWTGNGLQEPLSIILLSNDLGGLQLFFGVNGAQFTPTVMLLPYSALTFDIHGNLTAIDWTKAIMGSRQGQGAAFVMTAVPSGDTQEWFAVVSSTTGTAGASFSWQSMADPSVFVPAALTELDYIYYLDGSVHTVTDKSDVTSGNTATTTYSYNNQGQVINIMQSGSGASPKSAAFLYYDNGQTKIVTAGPYVATYLYDGAARLYSLVYTNPGGGSLLTGSQPISYGLEYDPADNILEESSADGVDSFTLDYSNQLKQATLTSETYTYDSNGNRTSGNYQTGLGNRMIYDGAYYYTYDANGNRTTRYKSSTGAFNSSASDITIFTWDYENRLTMETHYTSYANYQSGLSNQIVSYTYDYLGRTIRRGIDDDGSAGSDAMTYSFTVYDGQNAYLQVSDSTPLSGTGTPSVSQRYLYGPTVNQILATDNGGGNVLWGLADGAGTIRDVVNNSGVDQNHVKFDSFGKPLSTMAVDFLFGQNGMRYDQQTGEYRTETDTYDPSTGQRLSQDDLGFASGTTNFTTWAGNSPVQNADPSGLFYTYNGTGGSQNNSAGTGLSGGNNFGLPWNGNIATDYGSATPTSLLDASGQLKPLGAWQNPPAGTDTSLGSGPVLFNVGDPTSLGTDNSSAIVATPDSQLYGQDSNLSWLQPIQPVPQPQQQPLPMAIAVNPDSGWEEMMRFSHERADAQKERRLGLPDDMPGNMPGDKQEALAYLANNGPQLKTILANQFGDLLVRKPAANYKFLTADDNAILANAMANAYFNSGESFLNNHFQVFPDNNMNFWWLAPVCTEQAQDIYDSLRAQMSQKVTLANGKTQVFLKDIFALDSWSTRNTNAGVVDTYVYGTGIQNLNTITTKGDQRYTTAPIGSQSFPFLVLDTYRTLLPTAYAPSSYPYSNFSFPEYPIDATRQERQAEDAAARAADTQKYLQKSPYHFAPRTDMQLF